MSDSVRIRLSINYKVAAIYLAATIFLSCSNSLPQTEEIDSSKIPTQVIDNMSVQQSEAGKPRMRLYALKMERYTNTTPAYDIFPQGINVKAFTSDGMLETEITAKIAKHIISDTTERWEAYGNVVIKNYIKGETMETDTLYWDRSLKTIYTHCLVKMKTPDMYMQGIGMKSDEMARNAIILKPFDSYGVVKRDSTEVPYIDSVNFIGPFLKKKR